MLALLPALSATAAPESGASGISQQQAASIAQQAHPGRVLGVRRKGEVYRVKTLSTNGEVREIAIDASSGKIISGR